MFMYCYRTPASACIKYGTENETSSGVQKLKLNNLRV